MTIYFWNKTQTKSRSLCNLSFHSYISLNCRQFFIVIWYDLFVVRKAITSKYDPERESDPVNYVSSRTIRG